MFFKEILQAVLSYFFTLKYFVKLYKYLIFILLTLTLFSFPIFIVDKSFQAIEALIPFHSANKYALIGVQFIANISGFFLLIILSPVFSMVSEEIIHLLSGKKFIFSFSQLLKDIIRGIKITIRNLIYEYFYIIIISLTLMILPENQFIKTIGFIMNTLVVSYFYGFSLLDYALENHRINYINSINFVRKHSGLAVGLGLVYYLMISINDINIVKQSLGHFSIYWTAFGEGLVAYLGVIAGSLILFKKLSKFEKTFN